MKSQTLIGKYLKLRAIEDRDRAILIDTKRDAEFLRLVGQDELSYEKLDEDDFVSMRMVICKAKSYWCLSSQRLLKVVLSIDNSAFCTIILPLTYFYDKWRCLG